MNYIFINTELGSDYPVLYRHDVYGETNPRFIDCVNWLRNPKKIKKGECNLSLTVL